MKTGPKPIQLHDRFLSNIIIPMLGGCWLWVPDNKANPYPSLMVGSRTDKSERRIRMSRYSYQTYKGPVPSHLSVCHACDNPSCVNPNHLFLGTQRDNIQDARAKGRLNNGRRSRFVCSRGHHLSGSNLVITADGARRCKICRASCTREWKGRQQEKRSNPAEQLSCSQPNLTQPNPN